jgi:hypothetical protein
VERNNSNASSERCELGFDVSVTDFKRSVSLARLGLLFTLRIGDAPSRADNSA